jgi:hypothetical protein
VFTVPVPCRADAVMPRGFVNDPHDIALIPCIAPYRGDAALAEVMGRYGGLGLEADGGIGRPVDETGEMEWR